MKTQEQAWDDELAPLFEEMQRCVQLRAHGALTLRAVHKALAGGRRAQPPRLASAAAQASQCGGRRLLCARQVVCRISVRDRRAFPEMAKRTAEQLCEHFQQETCGHIERAPRVWECAQGDSSGHWGHARHQDMAWVSSSLITRPEIRPCGPALSQPGPVFMA